MNITPINMAEGIIEPFFDPEISALSKWIIGEDSGQGLVVKQNWCWASFEWARIPEDHVPLRMNREFDVDSSDYNDLILSVMAPPGSVVKIEVTTDLGVVTGRSKAFRAVKQEVPVNLRGASRISGLFMEIHSRREGNAGGWFNWIGLRHRRLLKRYEKQWRQFDSGWEKYLQPEGFVPSFKPVYGVLITDFELDALRVQHADMVAAGQISPFEAAGRFAAGKAPEESIADHVNFWHATRYNRVRDHGKILLTYGPDAAVDGLLRRDPSMMRLAARYALSIAHCEHWEGANPKRT